MDEMQRGRHGMILFGPILVTVVIGLALATAAVFFLFRGATRVAASPAFEPAFQTAPVGGDPSVMLLIGVAVVLLIGFGALGLLLFVMLAGSRFAPPPLPPPPPIILPPIILPLPFPMPPGLDWTKLIECFCTAFKAPGGTPPGGGLDPPKDPGQVGGQVLEELRRQLDEALRKVEEATRDRNFQALNEWNQRVAYLTRQIISLGGTP